MIRCFLCLFLLGICGPLFAQDDDPLQWIRSPRWVFSQSVDERPIYYAAWNGESSWLAMRFFMRGDEANELGLSEEQSEKFAFLKKNNELGVDWFRKKFESRDEKFMEAVERSEKALRTIDPDMKNVTDEQRTEYTEAQGEVIGMWLSEMQEDIKETLSPEQMQKLRSLELIVLPEMGLPNPEIFEPLGLSEEQKKEMQKIKDEMRPIFDAQVNDTLRLREKYLSQMVENLIKANEEKKIDFDKLGEAMNKAGNIAAQSEEYRKANRENMLRGRKFATELKERLMNVLTDEQLDKMQEMLDSPPEFIRKMMQELRKAREIAEKEEQWKPGPDSWRPGSESPKEFKEKRQRESVFPSE